MDKPADPPAKAAAPPRTAAAMRDARLAAALKANIARRKAQVGGRADPADDDNDNNEQA